MATVGGVIFGADLPSVTNAVDGTTYALGTQFRSDVSGTIPEVYWHAPTSEPGGYNAAVEPVMIYLWKNSTAEIKGIGMFDALVLGQWNPTDVSWSIEANTDYTLSVITDYYVSAPYYFESAKINGHITAPVSAGRFTAIGDSVEPTMPTSEYHAGAYFVDFAFIPTAPPGPSMRLWDGTSELAVTSTLWTGTSEVSVLLDAIS